MGEVKIKLNSTQVVVEVEVRVELGKNRFSDWVSFYFVLFCLRIILFWSCGWLEKVKIKLKSTQVIVEVEVRVGLGKIIKLI